MHSFAEYAKAPAGSFFTSQALLGSDNRSLFGAREVLSSLQNLGTNVHTAHFGSPETLTLNGKPVTCTVLQFSDKDATEQRGTHYAWQMTLWVDPATLSVAKTERRAESHFIFGSTPPPFAPTMKTTEVITFSVVDFRFEPKADTFTFAPPASVREVEHLPAGMTGPPPPRGPDARTAASAKYVRKPLPDVPVLDEEGKQASLTRYLGHPLLIDVWATWCGPCLSEMPLINRIRKAVVASDLQIVGVDEDLHSADARALLQRRGYDWKDYAYTLAFSRALSTSGIPLTVLVDSSGKIVYHHTGADDSKGLIAAVSELGKQYQVTQVK